MTPFERALMILIIEDEEELREFMKGDSILESVGNDIISYSRAKEIVTAYENAMIEENYRNNLAREEASKEKQIEIAKSMLEKNMDINLISELTNLSLEELKELM